MGQLPASQTPTDQMCLAPTDTCIHVHVISNSQIQKKNIFLKRKRELMIDQHGNPL